MDEDFKGVFISEEGVAEYIYKRLVELGYAPTSDEILDIAEIVFDFLLENSFMDIVDSDDVEGDQ